MPRSIDDIKSVLVLMTDKHMGNVLVALPAIAALRERFKGRRFTLAVDEAYAAPALSVEGIDLLMKFPRKAILSNAITGTAVFLKFVTGARAERPDVAIDLEGGHASALISLFSGARVRAARKTAVRPWAYNLKADIPSGGHKAFSYAGVSALFGADAGGILAQGFKIKPSGADIDSVRRVLDGAGLTPQDRLVCLHAGAGKEHKMWGAEGFAETADRLASTGCGDIKIIFIGGPSEAKITAKATSLMSAGASDLTGKLTLGQLSALFSLSSLFVGNDSGPMHLAAMCGTPVVALFGPADETRWAPLSRRALVLRGGKRCLPCTNEDCTLDFVCIRSIKADAVVEAAMRLLDEPRMNANERESKKEIINVHSRPFAVDGSICRNKDDARAKIL
jgi:heptosyltransferase-3